MLISCGVQVVLAKYFYHLYLEPGDEIIKNAGDFQMDESGMAPL